MRDEVLLDYLLHQLSEAETRQLEARLHVDGALAARLERLRRRLQPLEQERQRVVSPRQGLAERTLARLQSLWPRPFCSLPQAPRTLPDWRITGGRFRPDILVAGCILILASGLFLSAVGKLRARHDWLACQNTLRLSYVQQQTHGPSASSQEVFGPVAEPSLPYASWPSAEAVSSCRPVVLCSLTTYPENTSPPLQPVVFHSTDISSMYGSYWTMTGRPDRSYAVCLLSPHRGQPPEDGCVPGAFLARVSKSRSESFPFLGHPYGCNILYADGHVQCSTFPACPPGGNLPRWTAFKPASFHSAD
jgi:prepilin-type processing-associated H-X9-DG protein